MQHATFSLTITPSRLSTVKVYHEHRLPTSTMDTPATLQKRLASSPLNAEARHPTASIRSISPPRAERGWEGAYVWDKNTSARHCAKNAGGAYARGGGAYLRDTTVLVIDCFKCHKPDICTVVT